MKTPEEEELQSYSLQNGDHNSKLDKLRQQGNMFQMKEQDKSPEEQLSEVDRGSTWKRAQSNDNKDNPGSQKKNRGTDQEDTKNV